MPEPRVLHLVVPPGPPSGSGSIYKPVLPKGPLELAAFAEGRGWTTAVFDFYSQFALADLYLEHLPEIRVDLVGISIHGPPSLAIALDLCRKIRDIYPEIPFLFGGQMAVSAAELILPLLPRRSLLFAGDVAALNDGLELALNAAETPLLVTSTDIGHWRVPMSFGSMLPRLEWYLSHPEFEYHLATQIGCPFRCFHCGTGRKGLLARTVNRDLDNIRVELGHLEEHCRHASLPLPRLWITDETFFASPEFSLAVCNLLIELGGAAKWQWRAQSRLDSGLSPAILSYFKDAGCWQMAFGIEIPTTAGLALLGKRETEEPAGELFASCRKLGINVEAIVVVGSPGDETPPETLLATLAVLNPSSVQSYIYHPIPGSPWWRKYGRAFLQSSDDLDWSRLDFHSPPLEVDAHRRRNAIAAFLALQMWRDRKMGVGEENTASEIWDRLAFQNCLEPLVRDPTTGIGVFYTASESGETFIAAGCDSFRVLELPSGFTGNLFSRLSDEIPIRAFPDSNPAKPESRRGGSNSLGREFRYSGTAALELGRSRFRQTSP